MVKSVAFSLKWQELCLKYKQSIFWGDFHRFSYDDFLSDVLNPLMTIKFYIL